MLSSYRIIGCEVMPTNYLFFKKLYPYVPQKCSDHIGLWDVR